MSEDKTLRISNAKDWTFLKESPISHIHGLHSYPARMHPPVARKLIKLYASEGNLVLDPFCGSGGVLSEALIQGCNCIGIDLNPLACLISRVKTTVLNSNIINLKFKLLIENINQTLALPQIKDVINSTKKVSDAESEQSKIKRDQIDSKSNESKAEKKELETKIRASKAKTEQTIEDMFLQFKKLDIKLPELSDGNLFFWFKPQSIVELAIIKYHIDRIPEIEFREFFSVCFSNTVRDVSGTRNGEFKLYRITLPEWEAYKPDALNIFSKRVITNIKNMKEYKSLFRHNQNIGHTIIINSDSRKIFSSDFPEEGKKALYESEPTGIKGKVNLIVTSPPYGDSSTTVAYGQYSRYSSFWLGYEKESYYHVDKRSLGGTISEAELHSDTLRNIISQITSRNEKRAKQVKSFYIDFNECLSNFHKVLVENGKACFVVGNRTVKDVKIPTDNIIIELGEAIGFRKLTTYSRSIPMKRMPLKNSPTNVKGQSGNTMDAETIVVLEKP